MKLAIWSTITPRPNSTHVEMFRRQLEEVELAELIAAAARTTSRMRFAGMVNILPFRHPLLVAEEAAMLDNLTDGRFDMGLGRGLRPPEFEAFGVDQAQSREMFVESFDIIQRVFADEIFEHRGEYLDGAEGCASGAPAGAAAPSAVPGQRAERGVAALGRAARYPVRADRLVGGAGAARCGVVSYGSDGARACADAAALYI